MELKSELIEEYPVRDLDILYVGGYKQSITLRGAANEEPRADTLVVTKAEIVVSIGDETITCERPNILSYSIRARLHRARIDPPRPPSHPPVAQGLQEG